MLFSKHFRRTEAPWEVVDSRNVLPIAMWDEDDELDVVRMHNSDITVKFDHELHRMSDVRKAMQFARQQLMQDASRLKYNILLLEGWRCTLLRKGNRYRVDIVYSGRPAFAGGKITPLPPPPFIDVLDHYQSQLYNFRPPALSTAPVIIGPKRSRRWIGRRNG